MESRGIAKTDGVVEEVGKAEEVKKAAPRAKKGGDEGLSMEDLEWENVEIADIDGDYYVVVK